MLRKFILPSIAISGVIFASFFVILAQYGSETIEIRVDERDFLNGKIRDIFSPGMGGALSLTLGLASVATIGYIKSVRRQDKLEKQLLFVKRAILDKDAQIQELKKDEQTNILQHLQ